MIDLNLVFIYVSLMIYFKGSIFYGKVFVVSRGRGYVLGSLCRGLTKASSWCIASEQSLWWQQLSSYSILIDPSLDYLKVASAWDLGRLLETRVLKFWFAAVAQDWLRGTVEIRLSRSLILQGEVLLDCLCSMQPLFLLQYVNVWSQGGQTFLICWAFKLRNLRHFDLSVCRSRLV